MRKRSIVAIMLMISIIVVAGFQLLPITESDSFKIEDRRALVPNNSDIDLVVISDIHYIADRLVEDSPVFINMVENGDGKDLIYIDTLIEAFINQMLIDQPDGVIVTGDITFNGEQLSHEQMADLFSRLNAAGIKVYVMPGNHDLNNYYAIGFKGEETYRVDRLSGDAFSELYHAYGYQEALATDSDSLSYVTVLREDVWLIMLDSNNYESNNMQMKSVTKGQIKSGTLAWLAVVLEEAEAQHVTPVLAMHHNLFQHHPLFEENFVIENSEEVLALLREYDVRVNLSGHIHAQHIEENEGIYDIVTGAYSVFPNRYGAITIDEKRQFNYQTKPVDVSSYAKEIGETNPDLINYHTYGPAFFHDVSYRKAFMDLLLFDKPDEVIIPMAEVFAEVNTLFFAGTVAEERSRLLESEGYQNWLKDGKTFYSEYLQSVLNTEEQDENSLTIELD